MLREIIIVMLIGCVLITGCIFDLNGEKGTFEVTSSPTGAAVYFDNVLRGPTPITINEVAFGSHRLELTYQGYQNWSKNVSISSDKSQLFVPLLPISTPMPTQTPVLDKYQYCVEKLPGTHYDFQTNQCLYPGEIPSTPRPTKTPIIDNYIYCVENYPGTHYDPQTNWCRKGETPMPTRDNSKYCAENAPGSQYNSSTDQCEYPLVVVTTQGSNNLGKVNK